MQIQIKLVGLFKTDRFETEMRTYPDGAVVRDVVTDLRLPLVHLGIILLNDLHAEMDTPLADGDALTLLPFVDGG